jgi:hypothetical protein
MTITDRNVGYAGRKLDETKSCLEIKLRESLANVFAFSNSSLRLAGRSSTNILRVTYPSPGIGPEGAA